MATFFSKRQKTRLMEISEDKKKKVWEKGTIVPNFDPERFRKDACGAWISWDRYGDVHSPYGWQIDHIYPESKLRLQRFSQESIDDLINLRPMHWRNNESKGADYPTYHSVVKGVENHNEDIDDTFEVNATTQDKIRELYGI